MRFPFWMLLGFCGWTLAILGIGVGLWRWSLIFRGKAAITDFPGESPHGTPGYRRVVRAHANCLETLPIFAAVVLVAQFIHAGSHQLDLLAGVVMAARVVQSSVHMLLVENSLTVAVRFSFFFVQYVAVVWMGLVVAMHALAL
jgi:uncharacterized MAPEG superfamily protein